MKNWKQVRADFPILDRKIEGKPLIYLDNAATSQKPLQVINALKNYYENYNSNIHRGLHTMSEEATLAYEGARERIARFIDAASEREIIFTRNATEAINIVVESWGKHNIQAGDEIVITAMEHHSNFVPWQKLAEDKGAKLVYIELAEDGNLDYQMAERLITNRTKIVAVTQMSNVMGTVVDLQKLGSLAHLNGAKFLVDGAQGVPHLPTSVRESDCDFLVFSLHKMLGPTGVGVLYGKEELLDLMPPMLYGGDMISSVTREKTTVNELPWKFEAGTPNIADVIASGVAIDYLLALGMENVRAHELDLTRHAMDLMLKLPSIKIYGPQNPELKGGVISFNYEGVHPHDMGQILNESGIAIRAGHHCCQPLMKTLGVMGTARASFYIYNTKEEIDFFVEALIKAEKVLNYVACR
ncbi:MAG: cysteine desulfurase [Candidatus Melainabacteria bacterium]|nr:MAG: cysteine desulfurase [Candidatus Melainabacteria bacterium]